MAKFDIKTEATKPFYAGVGVTDLAVAAVRDYVSEAQKRFADVQKNVSKIDFEPTALRDQATTVVTARVEALSKDAKNRRTAIEKRVTELQKDAKAFPGKGQALLDEYVAVVNGTYGDLITRGENLVTRIRRQEATQATAAAAQTTTAKARTTTTQAKKATKSTAKKATTTARKQAAAPKSSAKATTTAAKKTASSAAKATTDAAEKVGD
jgi:heparin binding hemagglutinin HbhA